MNKIKNYLRLLLSFYQSDNIIKKSFNSNQWNSNQKIYLISRNWINCFFNLFNYNEINNALNQYLSYPQQNSIRIKNED